MKKIIFSLVAIFALASCNHDAEVYTLNPQTKAVNDYNEAFVKAFGSVGSNVDWGFGAQAASTRALTRTSGVGEVIKPDNGKDGIFEFTNDEKNATGWRSPEGVSKYVAPITDEERAWVQAWFDNPENRGLSEEGREFHNFYVQQVHNKLYSDAQDNKNGYFWQMNNGVEEHTNKTYKVKMDQLRIGSARDEASTVHINDFNATDNGFNAWNAIYVKDGSSKQFAYWASYGSQWQWKFRCVELEVPASCFPDNKPHKGWYVGLSYYCDKIKIADQKGERIGEDEIDICNDWILKIVPGKGEIIPPTPTTYRVIAEDLNASEASDFDFNDVVFDVEPNEAGNAAKIVVRAAGGIYKLTVAGQEVHAAFGQNAKADGTYPMINTNPWNPEVKATLFESYSGNFNSDANIRNTIKSIVIKVYKPGYEENGIELEAQTGKPACKILVDQTFNVVTERTGIADENTNFHKYVGGTWDTETNGFWWKKK